MNKGSNMELRSDADLQAIQTSVAFKNISDAVEQYRRQFGLAFLALVAFSAIHVGLVVIANLYTMQTKLHSGVMTDAADPSVPVTTGESQQSFDLQYIMSNLKDAQQIRALSDVRTASFVDRDGSYRQYSVTGFHLGGYKRSELKLFTSVGHVLQYVRGRGVQVYSENGSVSSCNCSSASGRKLLGKGGSPANDVSVVNVFTGKVTPIAVPADPSTMSEADVEAFSAAMHQATYGGASVTKTAGLVNDMVGDTGDVADSAATSAYSLVQGGSQAGWKTNDSAQKSMWWNVATSATKGTALENVVTGAATVASNAGPVPGYTEAYNQAQAIKAEEGLGFQKGDGAAWEEYLKSNDWYSGSGYEEYKNKVDAGGHDQMIVDSAALVIVGLTLSAHAYADSWESYMDNSDGFFNSAQGMNTRGNDRSKFGCTETNNADVFDEETTYYADGKPTTGTALFCANQRNSVLGGTFFSSILGAYDSFLMHTRHELMCGPSNADVGIWYLYFLHGWGESAAVLLEVEPVLTFLINVLHEERPDSGVANIVTFVVNDQACPYGGKTWYVNNEFTGYHMDLICFDLPAYAESALGFASLGRGLFGFSMGGFGAASIALTYPGMFFGTAMFNAVLDANPCMHFGYCHVLCGIDAFDCDVKWTTSHVAFTPYVLVGSNSILSSTGSFDPVSYGVAVRAMQTGAPTACTDAKGQLASNLNSAWQDLTGNSKTNYVAQSTNSASSYTGAEGPIVYTGANSIFVNNHRDAYGAIPPLKNQPWNHSPLSKGSFGDMWISFSANSGVNTKGDQYFYLNMENFARASQSFDPTFKVSDGSVIAPVWDMFMIKQPLHRIQSGKGFEHSPVFVLLSCDANDPYHLNAQAEAFLSSYNGLGGDFGPSSIYHSSSQLMHTDGGMIGDIEFIDPSQCGHCMHFRDFYVAYAFFADVFDTWTQCSSDRSNLVAAGASTISSIDTGITMCFTGATAGARGKRFASNVSVKSIATINGWLSKGASFEWGASERGTQYLSLQAMGVGSLQPSHMIKIRVIDASPASVMEGQGCTGFYGCAAAGGRADTTMRFGKNTGGFFGTSGDSAAQILNEKAQLQKEMGERSAELAAQYETVARD